MPFFLCMPSFFLISDPFTSDKYPFQFDTCPLSFPMSANWWREKERKRNFTCLPLILKPKSASNFFAVKNENAWRKMMDCHSLFAIKQVFHNNVIWEIKTHLFILTYNQNSYKMPMAWLGRGGGGGCVWHLITFDFWSKYQRQHSLLFLIKLSIFFLS